MRHPVTDLAGHLMWTTSGTVWATWRIQPLSYGMRPVKDKKVVKDLHRMLVRGFSGEAVMTGLSVSLDPTVVVERMLAGVDLESCPAWVAEASANLDRFSDPSLALGERVYYLSVPLANAGWDRLKAPVNSSWGAFKEVAGLPRAHPSASELQNRMQQAKLVSEAFPPHFKAEPVGVAEQCWLALHQQLRGMQDVPPETAVEIGGLVTTNGVALPRPVLDPGAKEDLAGRRAVNPLRRRVLKVTNPDRPDEASYQALLAMSSTPTGGATFPGGELLRFLDDLGPETDWTIRLKVNSRDKVMAANRKATRDLTDQYDQRGDSMDGSHDLDLAHDLLTDYQAQLANDRLEVEVEHQILLATGADTFEAVDQSAKHIQNTLGGMDFKFDRPVGGEEDLWWGMHPGVPTSAAVRAYSQFTTSENFARLVPFTTTKLGGRKGLPLVLNTATARAGVSHIDAGGYPELDKSGSIIVVGELGSGKSYAMKTIAASIVAQGGQLFSIDKSAEAEWVTFAQALPMEEPAVIVDPSDPQWSMDPLRTMSLDEGTNVAQAFLATLLGCSPREQDGITLGRVLQPQYVTEHHLTSMRQVMQHLLTDCTMPQAVELGQRIGMYADSSLGGVIFDDTLPPVVGTSAAVVWRTHRFAQPTEQEMATPHLFHSLPLDKILGRAYYRLLMGTARRWGFADRSRVTCFAQDEAYDLYSNPENVVEGEVIQRQGRRAKFFILAGSHAPETDFGSAELRGLIPTRLVMRHTDLELARQSIELLGLKPDDPEFDDLVKILREDTSPPLPDVGVPPERRGECFLRDAFGGVGPGKVLGPAQPALERAVNSTPPGRKVA